MKKRNRNVLMQDLSMKFKKPLREWLPKIYLKGLILLVALLLLPGKAMSNTLVDEVITYRKTHKQANLNVTEIVVRFIPLGCSEERAIEILRNNGFKVYLPNTDSVGEYGEKTITANKKLPASPPLGFGDELRVGLKLRNQLVHEIWATLIYRAL